MTILENIEKAVTELSSEDLASFKAWFAKFDAQIWDHQFSEDVTKEKLDSLAKKALKDLKSGRCNDL